MKRFLFVSHHPVFGGPENQALRLAEPLAERGWETTVVLTDEPGNSLERLVESGIRVVTMPLHRVRAAPFPGPQATTALHLVPEVVRLARLIRSERIDVVLLPGLENPHGAFAARLAGRPVVWQLLGTRTPVAFRRAMMPLVRVLADAVMPTGTTLLDHHPGADRLGDRVVPFFPPVNTDLFSPSASRRASARAELGFAPDDLVIGNVANLNAQKDHLTFVRAAARVRQTHPQARFLMLGETSESQRRYTESVWDEMAALGLRIGQDVVHHRPCGRVAELAPALDVFWLSSEARSEGVPTAMLEAMALEIPVVATRVGGVADVLREGHGGVLVEPGDPVALADRTLPILDDDEARRVQGRAARAVVLAEASLELCVDAHVRALTLADRRSAGPTS